MKKDYKSYIISFLLILLMMLLSYQIQFSLFLMLIFGVGYSTSFIDGLIIIIIYIIINLIILSIFGFIIRIFYKAFKFKIILWLLSLILVTFSSYYTYHYLEAKNYEIEQEKWYEEQVSDSKLYEEIINVAKVIYEATLKDEAYNLLYVDK